MSRLKIYGNPYSTCTQRILMALAEKQATSSAEVVVIDFATGQHKSAEHLKRQPFGKVPAAEDGDLHFFESRAIVRYVDDKYTTGNKLIPTAIDKKAVFEQWASLESTTYTNEVTTILAHRIWNKMKGLPSDENKIKEAFNNLQVPFDYLEQHLSKNEWLLGNEFSAIEVFFAPYLNLLFNTPEKSLIESRPSVAKWWKKVTERPSFSVTKP